MNKDIKIGTIGGDLRQLVCAKELAEKGFESAVFGFQDYKGSFGEATRCISMEDAITGSNAIILPLPASTNGTSLNAPFLNYDIPLEDLFASLKKDQLVFAGHVCDKTKALAEKHKLRLIDYYEREELQVLNAVPTVEGAIAIAINETPFTIHNAECLVLGYGRVGKVLCRTLSVLGAKVYAAARKYADFAWIKANGYQPIHIDDIANLAPKCDIIFNTIPMLVLGKELLHKIESRTLIIDLASKPGGVDFDTAKDLGLNVIWALSLPGKTAPLTSGKIMSESILNILSEMDVI